MSSVFADATPRCSKILIVRFARNNDFWHSQRECKFPRIEMRGPLSARKLKTARCLFLITSHTNPRVQFPEQPEKNKPHQNGVFHFFWHSQRESNPCYRNENPVS